MGGGKTDDVGPGATTHVLHSKIGAKCATSNNKFLTATCIILTTQIAPLRGFLVLFIITPRAVSGNYYNSDAMRHKNFMRGQKLRSESGLNAAKAASSAAVNGCHSSCYGGYVVFI